MSGLWIALRGPGSLCWAPQPGGAPFCDHYTVFWKAAEHWIVTIVGFPRLATPSSSRCRGPNCIPTKDMSKDLRLWPYLELRSLRMERVVITRWAPHPVGLCPFEKRKHEHREEGAETECWPPPEAGRGKGGLFPPVPRGALQTPELGLSASGTGRECVSVVWSPPFAPVWSWVGRPRTWVQHGLCPSSPSIFGSPGPLGRGETEAGQTALTLSFPGHPLVSGDPSDSSR